MFHGRFALYLASFRWERTKVSFNVQSNQELTRRTGRWDADKPSRFDTNDTKKPTYQVQKSKCLGKGCGQRQAQESIVSSDGGGRGEGGFSCNNIGTTRLD